MKKTKTILLVLAMLSIFMKQDIQAETEISQAAEGASYTIEPIKSDLQLNPEASYFHLGVEPNTKEQLEILVHNNSQEETRYKIRHDIAKTNKHGLIVYNEEHARHPNDSLTHNIEDFINLENKTVTVKPNDTGVFKINLDLKGQAFEDIVLGAFSVQEDFDKEKEAGIAHEYRYELGLVLTQAQDNALPNSKQLDLAEVKMELKDGHKALIYEIANLEAKIARNLSIKTTLTKTDEDKVLFDEKVENFSIAPNGVLEQFLDWNRKEVQPGTYLLEVDADDKHEKWHWRYEFTIEENEAKDLNTNATYIVRYPKHTFTLFIILGILTIINTLFLVMRQNKRM